LSGAHDRIGEELAGSVLACRACEATRTVSAADAAQFLRTGWPLCCGETMSMTSKKAD
jgi:hypothetical protein